MITEHNVNVTSKTVAKLGMEWRNRESKAQEFQDSFPKIIQRHCLPLIELEME